MKIEREASSVSYGTYSIELNEPTIRWDSENNCVKLEQRTFDTVLSFCL